MGFHQIPNTYIEQVALKVQSIERSVEFYKEFIGLKILHQDKGQAVLTADGKQPLLYLEEPVDVIPKQSRTTGLYHFALLVPTRSDLANVLQHFINKNLKLQGASDHLVSEALYLADPDGNGIEIYADRSSSEWEWNNGEVVMATKALNIRDLLSEVTESPWKGMPANTLMGHIHLHVSELTDTNEFYCKGLGFDVVSLYGNQALFISSGGYHHHIGLNTWNGVGAPCPDKKSVGLNWFSIVFSDEIFLQATVGRLQELSAPLKKESTHYFTEDPSGNVMKLVVKDKKH
ncbi:VOC family protein [Bacillus sp. AK128]